jgi:eukaryotic-like serine/threonine-protein kinase
MVGTTIAHYRIDRQLGHGGMGEVYAAEDTKLGRQVALKLLPAPVANDPERLKRLEREARAVAALNHPNIVTIYSVEEARLNADATPRGGVVHFLTMELVEGRTLREITANGALKPERFFRIAVQIAEAVGAAHQRGIVHRDLKPANVMVASDGRVKVLDFGLAKWTADHLTATPDALSTEPLTGDRTILGTAAYMSPEQAEGRPLDQRSDIFSLGVVLFEMATGRLPFKGQSAASTISSILRDTPPALPDLAPQLPLALDRIVQRCLAKDPERRYQNAFDLARDLEDLHQVEMGGPRARRASRRGRVAGAVTTLVLLAVIAGLLIWRLGRDQGRAREIATIERLTVEAGAEQFPGFSPDGKWIVYAGEASGNVDIYLRAMGGQAFNLTSDTPAADYQPAFSPDGERIAFRSDREGGGLFVMGRTGEAVRRLTHAGFNPAWSHDGRRIAFTTEAVTFNPYSRETNSELWVVDVEAGDARRVTQGDAAQASWAPSGRRLVYGRRFGTPSQADLWTIAVNGDDAQPLTNDRHTDWNPVWSPDGRHVYFVSDRGGSMNLWRIAIDAQTGRARGKPEAIVTPAPYLANPSLSADGRRIAYSSVVQTQNIQRATLNPSTGRLEGEPAWLTTGSRLWSSPDPSPDGQWIAVYSRSGQEDLWVIRADGTGLRQVTNDTAFDRVPRWSPDGSWIATFSNRSGSQELWAIRSDGSGLRQLTTARTSAGYSVWSPDGSRLAASIGRGGIDALVHVFEPDKPWDQQQPQVLPPLEPSRSFLAMSWSPDGKRLAGQAGVPSAGIVTYSFQTGTYARLTDFGEWPTWLSDSRRIIFIAQGRHLYLLDTQTKKVDTLLSVTSREVIGPPRVTSDDRQIYYSRRSTEADIWVLTLKTSSSTKAE